MEQKRTVLLLGAGAALDWGGPSTQKLTEIVLDSGFMTVSGETITRFIFRELTEKGRFPEKEVNFETIIHVIEELIVHYSQFDGMKEIPSLVKMFFDCKYEEEILNYSVECGDPVHGFKLEIPKGHPSPMSKSALNFETPSQFFFQQLLSVIITSIIVEVSKYSYHTQGNSKVITVDNQEMNDLLVHWSRKIISAPGWLRSYTLNYDRQIKIILESGINGLQVFEGFDAQAIVDYGAEISPNISRIILDADCHCHYNLHGCTSWRAEARDGDQLPNPSFALTAGPQFPVNAYELPVWQSEHGKTLMLSNIISGYQKTQRAILPPFRQMQSAFDRDCLTADTIYIVGYSFGDEHINASLRVAGHCNPGVKVIIVNPSFTQDELDLYTVIRVLNSFNSLANLHPTSRKENELDYFDGRIIVCTETFKKFLQSQG